MQPISLKSQEAASAALAQAGHVCPELPVDVQRDLVAAMYGHGAWSQLIATCHSRATASSPTKTFQPKTCSSVEPIKPFSSSARCRSYSLGRRMTSPGRCARLRVLAGRGRNAGFRVCRSNVSTPNSRMRGGDAFRRRGTRSLRLVSSWGELSTWPCWQQSDWSDHTRWAMSRTSTLWSRRFIGTPSRALVDTPMVGATTSSRCNSYPRASCSSPSGSIFLATASSGAISSQPTLGAPMRRSRISWTDIATPTPCSRATIQPSPRTIAPSVPPCI